MKVEPAVLEHAASFVGRSPWEVARDPELLYTAHLAAYRMYGHPHVLAGIDVYTVEPEAYGAELADPGGNGVPVLHKAPLSNTKDVLALTVGDASTFGRFPMNVEVAVALQAALPGVDVKVALSGPFTLVSHLLGLESLIMEAVLNPEEVTRAVQHMSEQQVVLAQYAAEKRVACRVYESAATPPFLSPAMFENIAAPALKDLLSACGEAPVLIAGGKMHLVADQLAALGAAFVICPREADGEAFMEAMEAAEHVTVRVNMDPRVFESDDVEALLAERDAVATIAAMRPGSVVGTGVLSYGARPEMVARVIEEG